MRAALKRRIMTNEFSQLDAEWSRVLAAWGTKASCAGGSRLSSPPARRRLLPVPSESPPSRIPRLSRWPIPMRRDTTAPTKDERERLGHAGVLPFAGILGLSAGKSKATRGAASPPALTKVHQTGANCPAPHQWVRP